jgi:hypothetical protein
MDCDRSLIGDILFTRLLLNYLLKTLLISIYTLRSVGVSNLSRPICRYYFCKWWFRFAIWSLFHKTLKWRIWVKPLMSFDIEIHWDINHINIIVLEGLNWKSFGKIKNDGFYVFSSNYERPIQYRLMSQNVLE